LRTGLSGSSSSIPVDCVPRLNERRLNERRLNERRLKLGFAIGPTNRRHLDPAHKDVLERVDAEARALNIRVA